MSATSEQLLNTSAQFGLAGRALNRIAANDNDEPFDGNDNSPVTPPSLVRPTSLSTNNHPSTSLLKSAVGLLSQISQTLAQQLNLERAEQRQNRENFLEHSSPRQDSFAVQSQQPGTNPPSKESSLLSRLAGLLGGGALAGAGGAIAAAAPVVAAVAGAGALGVAAYNHRQEISSVGQSVVQGVNQGYDRLTGRAADRQQDFRNRAIAAGIRDTELAQLMAQTREESGNFTRYSEGLNYSSVGRIRAVWGKRTRGMSDDQLRPLVGNAHALANFAYSNRRDLGNRGGEDGWNYRGRGPIQITGRAMYRKIGQAIGYDLESNPDALNDPQIAAQASIAYWKIVVEPAARRRNLQWNNTSGITRIVNGGQTNLDTRERYFSQEYQRRGEGPVAVSRPLTNAYQNGQGRDSTGNGVQTPNRGLAPRVAQDLVGHFGNGIRINSTDRVAGQVGNAGNKSHHVSSSALDVDHRAAQRAGITPEQIVNYLKQGGLTGVRFIDETSPEVMRRTGASGPHWHFQWDPASFSRSRFGSGQPAQPQRPAPRPAMTQQQTARLFLAQPPRSSLLLRQPAQPQNPSNQQIWADYARQHRTTPQQGPRQVRPQGPAAVPSPGRSNDITRVQYFLGGYQGVRGG